MLSSSVRAVHRTSHSCCGCRYVLNNYVLIQMLLHEMILMMFSHLLQADTSSLNQSL